MELEDRFEQKEYINPILALEELLLRAANGQKFSNQIKEVNESVYKKDFNFSQLQTQLLILPQVIKQSLPNVTKVTVIRTISEAMGRVKEYIKYYCLKYIN